MDDDLLSQLHLRYVTDRQPGIRRISIQNLFRYVGPDGNEITDEATHDRINKLHIPPAYTKVWICRFPNGHLQATGHDDRQRKQYRYHELFIKFKQQTKFDHLLEFAKALPIIRNHVKTDLSKQGLPKEKVIATIVWLLENTLIRVGNDEYAKENKSYGLTTLKSKHADIDGNTVHFSFKGKSGVYHDVDVKNKKVADIISKCQDLPGQELFQYLDEDGQRQAIDSADVNEYLQNITGMDITAKDFRTWGGTMFASQLLDQCPECIDDTEVKKQLSEVAKEVASHLRNKPATCRKYYIHPLVFDAFTKGVRLSSVPEIKSAEEIPDLDPLEQSTIRLLQIPLT